MSITEQIDASSYLIAPTDSGDDFVATLEQDAGLVLGGIDWFIHKFFHVSVIAEIVKPITGDWNSLERAQSAWLNAGNAAHAVGANFGAVPAQTQQAWTGDAADAFRSRMTSISSSMNEYGDGAKMIGDVVQGLVEVSQAAAEVIATVISFIGDFVERLVAEAAVPVIGWIAGAFDVAAHAAPFWEKLHKGYEVIKKVVEAVEKVIEALYKIVDKISKIEKIVSRMMTITKVGNATAVDPAAANAFGTS